MRTAKFSPLLVFCLFLCASVFVSGCQDKLKDLRIRNDIQSKKIADIESQLADTLLKLEQAKSQLAVAKEQGGIETDALQQKVAALVKDLEDKKALIAQMQQRLLYGGAQIPVELSTKLEDFAGRHEMVTYDPSTGIVKFKSDLLFEKGSDVVASTAVEAVKSLCAILNTDEARKFDIVVAGHTDDIPIGKPETRAKHPTNWHLSAHRAISVLNIMARNGIGQQRVSVRGFGEYRPVVPNQAGNKGNPQNRRVELYIVPKGA